MCTNFKLRVNNKNENGIVVGRSQEFSEDLKSKLYFRDAGHRYSQTPESIAGEIKNDKPLHYRWTGKYGFVGMSIWDIKNANDGMNTEGLTTSAMWLPSTRYPEYDEKKGLAVDYFTDWVLSSFATCQEVKDALLSREVVVTGSNLFQGMPLHFPVHDAFGNSIVIEFIDGHTRIRDNNDVGVLTNDPPFEWHLENLRNYVGITPWDVSPAMQFGNYSVHQTGHGSGFARLPGSPTPPDRFVRAAMMTHYSYPGKDLDSTTNLAWHILNTVDIPIGINRFHPPGKDCKTHEDYPQWAVVADLKRKIYSVRMYDSPLVYSVELTKLNLEEINGKLFPVPRDQGSIDITGRIQQM